jgi:curculin domain protein (mannose-binding) lectin
MKFQTIRIIPKTKKINYRHLPLFVFAFFMVFALSFLIFKNLKKSSALSVSDFHAGNIISDYTMSNTSAMNESQIQEFLTKKNPCGDTNIWRANQYSGYKYHIENGKFVCLSQETFEHNGAKQTAAQVIYEAARDYRINPQVLLVLIEKEQSLVSDTWPNSIQYRSATGFGCPDTAECDSKYYGFRNQVRNAAKLFRDVLDGGYTNYPVGQNFIYYNPNFACGGSQVYIENLATSALYRYTPYQPNAAAVANYPGTSYCGAYGNRNFYALFIRWFGDPTATVRISQEKSDFINDGEYYIKTTKGLFLKNQNKELILDQSNGTEIKLQKNDSGRYFILNQENLYLTNSDYNVKFQDFSNYCNQEWILKKQDNYYSLNTACNDFYLDVRDGNVDKNGNSVWSYSRNNTESQKFKLVRKKEINSIDENTVYNLITPDNKAIDTVNIGVENGTELQTYINAQNEAQRFKFKETDDGYYQITGVKSGKAIDLRNASLSGGSSVQLYDINNSCAQKWFLKKTTEGYYRIQSACSGMVFDSVKANTDGERVKVYPEDLNKKTQLWKIQKDEKIITENQKTANETLKNNVINDIQNGTYIISSFSNKEKVLDVMYAGTVNMANISLYQKWGNNNMAQMWKVEKDSTGFYRMSNLISGRSMDVYSGSMRDRTNIWLYDSNNTCAQKWKLMINNDKSVSILSACDEKMSLDIDDTKIENGTNIQLYQKWGENNIAQKWYFEKVQ